MLDKGIGKSAGTPRTPTQRQDSQPFSLASVLEEKPNDDQASRMGRFACRLVVKEVLDEKPDLVQIHRRCLKELSRWDEKREKDKEPIVAGWVNVLAELLRSNGTPIPGVSSNEALRPELPSVLSLLSLAREKDGGKALRTAIAGSSEWKDWPSPLKGWHDLFLGEHAGNGRNGGERRKLAKTDLGQTLILHLLEAMLAPYEKCVEVRSRGQFNVLLVPLIRAVFTYPDRAHAAYERYLYGWTDKVLDPFTRLYEHDLVILEEFQDYSISRRPETIDCVRKAAEIVNRARDGAQDQSKARRLPPMPGVLLDRANMILHGKATDEATTSPDPKRIRISQLSCLVRDTSAVSAGGEARTFSSHLEETHYRRMELVSPAPVDHTFTWTTSDKKQEFLSGVRQYYTDGYKTAHLEHLFGREANDSANESDGALEDRGPMKGEATASMYSPTWIQDGEVTFLWLVSAWAQVKKRVDDDLNAWIETSIGKAPSVPIGVIDDRNAPTVGEGSTYIGKSLKEFATEHACLFDKSGQPLYKAWALVNFLERVVVHGRIAQYSLSRPHAGRSSGDPGSLASIAHSLYAGLSGKGTLSFEAFKKACGDTIGRFKNIEQLQVAEESRFPSFALELVLRDRDLAPYSLFFYPLAFDAHGLPTVFIAGTFAGLEWSSYPSVTERQNCHLFVLLDGLRPIVDFEVGRVLDYDQQRLASMAVLTERLEVAQRIIPEVDKLSRLFEDAQGRVFQIQAAVDPDWGGLLSGALDRSIEKCFTDGNVRIESNMRKKEESAEKQQDWGRDPEQAEFTARHRGIEEIEAATLLYDRLVYIARDKFHYKERGLIPENTKVRAALVMRMKPAAPRWPMHLSTYEPTSAEQLKRAYSNNEFFTALFMSLAPDSAADLNILFRLLTQGASEAGRGLHVAQLAAALAMSAAETRETSVAYQRTLRAVERIRGLPGGPITGKSFNPKTQSGLSELSRMIEAERHERRVHSTGDLQYRVTLANGMTPFRFLRALKKLGGEALNPVEEGVKLVEWVIEWSRGSDARGMAKGIIVRLICNEQFPSDKKAELRGCMKELEGGYHDVRTNLRDLCLGIGSAPVFTKDITATPDKKPFYIVEYVVNGRRKTDFKFILGTGESDTRRGRVLHAGER